MKHDRIDIAPFELRAEWQ